MTATYLGIKGTRANAGVSAEYVSGGGSESLCGVSDRIRLPDLERQFDSRRRPDPIAPPAAQRLHGHRCSTRSPNRSTTRGWAGKEARRGKSPLIAQNWLDLPGRTRPFEFRSAPPAQLADAVHHRHGNSAAELCCSGWKGALFKEWTIATQITAGSGLPLTPVYLAAVRGTGVTGSIRPDYTGSRSLRRSAGLLSESRGVRRARAGPVGKCGTKLHHRSSQFVLNASMGRTFRFSDRRQYRSAPRLHECAQPRDVSQLEHDRDQRAVRTAQRQPMPCARVQSHSAGEVLTHAAEFQRLLAHGAGLLPRKGRSRTAPRRTQPAASRFNPSTQLVVEIGHRQRQERQARRRTDGEGFHRHRRRRAADHPLLRVPEAAGESMRFSPRCRRRGHGQLSRLPHNQIAPEPPGDIRYREPPPAGALLRHDGDAGRPTSCARWPRPRSSSGRR